MPSVDISASLDILELEPVRLPENPSQSEINSALDKEAEMIIKKIPEGSEVYTLCVEGKQYDSVALANLIGRMNDESGKIALIIGSSHGLSDKVKKASALRFSMSALTFPHQLARVMLLEQIYRAFMISSGTKYHK